MLTLIGDLSPLEIETLTDAQIAHYIELECADSGAPIKLPPVPECPVSPLIEMDVVVYQLQNVTFANKSDADEVQAIIEKSQLVNLDYNLYVNGSYLHYVTGADDTPTIGAKRVFSAAAYASVRAGLEAYNSAKKEYDEDRKEFNKLEKAHSEASERVWERVHAARRIGRDRERVIECMREYERLAEGNMEIAMRFLRKAMPEVENKFPELFKDQWLRYSILSARQDGVAGISSTSV